MSQCFACSAFSHSAVVRLCGFPIDIPIAREVSDSRISASYASAVRDTDGLIGGADTDLLIIIRSLPRFVYIPRQNE